MHTHITTNHKHDNDTHTAVITGETNRVGAAVPVSVIRQLAASGGNCIYIYIYICIYIIIALYYIVADI